MALYQDISNRNTAFIEETARILGQYLDKLDSIANKLLNKEVSVLWNYIDHMNGMSDHITIHGLIKTVPGDIIFDKTSGEKVLVTDDNSHLYAKYLKIMVKASRMETASADEIVNDIKELQHIKKPISGEEFQTLDITPKVKH